MTDPEGNEFCLERSAQEPGRHRTFRITIGLLLLPGLNAAVFAPAASTAPAKPATRRVGILAPSGPLARSRRSGRSARRRDCTQIIQVCIAPGLYGLPGSSRLC
jgi:hypothetical protein